MNRRGISIGACLGVLLALSLAAWLGGDRGGPSAPGTPGSAYPAKPGEYEGRLTGMRPDPGHEPRGPVPRAQNWWRSGTVKSLLADPGTVVVEAHWFRSKPDSREAKPDAIYSSKPLTFALGAATYRVEGEGTGFTLLFLRRGDRLEPLRPRMHEFRAATPGVGLGSSMPGLVGTKTIRGLLHDRGGMPIPDAKLQIVETIEGQPWPTNVVTDAEGRFTVEASPGGPFQVTYNAVAQHQNHPEFVGFIKRDVPLEDGELRVALQRNPRVTFRGRVQGHPHASIAFAHVARKRLNDPEAWIAFGFVNTSSLEVVVTPGRWHLRPMWYRGSVAPVVTPDLDVDQAVDIDVWVTPKAGAPLLKVIPEVPGVGPQTRIDLAVHAGHWEHEYFRGLRRTYDTPEALIVGKQETLEVRAAVRVNGDVWIGRVEGVELRNGEVHDLLVPMERAAALRVQAIPNARSGQEHLRLRGPRAERSIVVEDTPWRLAGFADRRKDATWWCPPGAYVLDTRKKKFPFEVGPGQAAHVTWVTGGIKIDVR